MFERRILAAVNSNEMKKPTVEDDKGLKQIVPATTVNLVSGVPKDRQNDLHGTAKYMYSSVSYVGHLICLYSTVEDDSCPRDYLF